MGGSRKGRERGAGGRGVPSSSLRGCRVLVTGGAARAYLDQVRFLTSASTGATAAALAAEAARRGAAVTYLHAPGARRPRAASSLVREEAGTVAEVAAALRRLAPGAAAVLHAMAVPDFAPTRPLAGKRPSRGGLWRVTLVPTPKLLEVIRAAAPGAFLVAFKLEATERVDELLAAARRLLLAGHADLVVANRLQDAEPRRRRAWLVDGSGRAEEVAGLARLAVRILDAVEEGVARRAWVGGGGP